jgi:hypothetical protein
MKPWTGSPEPEKVPPPQIPLRPPMPDPATMTSVPLNVIAPGGHGHPEVLPVIVRILANVPVVDPATVPVNSVCSTVSEVREFAMRCCNPVAVPERVPVQVSTVARVVTVLPLAAPVATTYITAVEIVPVAWICLSSALAEASVGANIASNKRRATPVTIATRTRGLPLTNAGTLLRDVIVFVFCFTSFSLIV